MTSYARGLRREATPEERALWLRLRHMRPRFTRQLPVGRYILDFACRTIKLAVELDGGQHLRAAIYDAKRTEFLESLGWKVMRFPNSDVRENVEGVAEAIVIAASRCGGPNHPQPLPSREERGSGTAVADKIAAPVIQRRINRVDPTTAIEGLACTPRRQ